MSRHEGVSCDSCLKSNFTGRRYKCLICYDYDLCADCYEDGATSTRHLNEHPMQCILTRADIELYFGGELLSTEQPQSFTCPYCKKMGFSDQTLADHVNNEHTETGLEVVCPVCAGSPGGDPNLVTDDFAGHLTLGHRSGPRELMSFLDEPSAIRHGGGVRRIQPGRALGGPRSRRTNMHFSSSSGLANLSPSGRESVDPIAELLSQLSGVRRTGGSSQQSSQLQQLQMQIQLERQQQASATRQQLERFPRRNHPMVSTSNVNSSMAEVVSGNGGGGSTSGGGTGNISVSSGPPVGLIGSQSGIGVATMNSRNGGVTGEIPLSSSGMHVASFGNANPNLFGGLISGIASGINNIHLANNVLSSNAPPPNTAGSSSNDSHSQFLLPKFLAPSLADEQLAQIEKDRADRSQFVQALMLSTLSSLKLDGSDPSDNDDYSDLSDVNKNTNSDMSNNNETNSEVTTQTPINNQVDQQQQTNPDDFLEEYSYQQQATTPQPQPQHPTQPNYNKKKQQSSTASATAAAVVLERRGKPPPPSSGQQQQQPQPPQGRAASKVVSATKEIPDTR